MVPICESTSIQYYEDRFSKDLCTPDVSRKGEEPGDTVMAADEENALRYASGFVAFKLLRKYAQQTGPDPEAEAVAECLPQMAVPGKLSSYYDYTTEWLEKVDRGELFCINNKTYWFFKQLEVLTRFHLLNPSAQEPRRSIDGVSDIKTDEDLLFCWYMLAVYVSAEWADKLLTDTVTLWLPITGHSMATELLKEFKEANYILTRKKKVLNRTEKSWYKQEWLTHA